MGIGGPSCLRLFTSFAWDPVRRCLPGRMTGDGTGKLYVFVEFCVRFYDYVVRLHLSGRRHSLYWAIDTPFRRGRAYISILVHSLLTGLVAWQRAGMGVDIE